MIAIRAIKVVKNCNGCPFCHFYTLRFYCEHPDGRNRDARPEDKHAPDWCPLRTSEIIVKLRYAEVIS